MKRTALPLRAAARRATAPARALRGFSIHGIVASARLSTPPIARRTAHAGAVLAAGSILIGAGVGLLVRADLGLPPYDVLASVLRDSLGISQGQAGWLLAGSLLLVAAAFRRFPQPATAAYVLSTGLAVDIALRLVRTPDAVAVRWALVAIGTAFLAAGVALVVHSGLGGGAFELLMLAAADRGIDPMRVRTFLEVGVLGAGIALGGDFGPATVAFAVTIGPLLRAGSQALEDHRRGRDHRLEEVARAA